MRIAIMGAGAIGCYYGGRLACAGHDVTLIGRPRLVEAVRHHGLRIQTDDTDTVVALAASTDPAATRNAKIVLCCVKTGDTAAAAAAMAPFLGPDTVIVSLQNGVENRDLLRGALANEIIPAAVYVAVAMAGEGHVRHHGGGALVIGRSSASPLVAAMFESAGVPVEISDDIDGVLWTKLIINCAYNALSAITTLPYGTLVRHEGVEQVLLDVVAECQAVATRAGITPAGDVLDAVRRIPKVMPGQTSSTAQDLQRGRRSEIDYLNGYIVRRGETLKISTPANRLLHTLVKILEGQRTGSTG